MTEDEAKQKMCPHFASAALQTPGMGRLEQDEIVTAMRCKGSDCMMWRWLELPMHLRKGTFMDDDGTSHNVNILSNTQGRCGLGGKP
jgi:hypothetical protein